MVDHSFKRTSKVERISFPSMFTYEYYEDAVDEMLDLGFEPYSTLGSSFSWKREAGKEGYYTLGTIEIVDENTH